MKCKKCKQEMQEVDSGFDFDNNMNIDFECYGCKLICEAQWLYDKPQKSVWKKAEAGE